MLVQSHCVDASDELNSGTMSEEVDVVSRDSSPGFVGFYCGAGVGMNFVKSQFKNGEKSSATPVAGTESSSILDKVKKSRTGFGGNVFGGYNAQFGAVLVGIEGVLSVNPWKTKANLASGTEERNVSVKRCYGIGVAPRIGYPFGGCLVYAKVVADLCRSEVKLENKVGTKIDIKKDKPRKVVMVAMLGIEKKFEGSGCFVRAECGKSFNKRNGTVDGTSASSRSWTGSLGAGYQF
jgi:hypothetical protein